MMLFLVAMSSTGIATSLAVMATQHLGEKEVDSHFKQFIEKHGRDYQHGSPEYNMRKELFAERLRAVLAHNSDPNRLWEADTTRFSDQTEDERNAVHGYRRGSPRASHASFGGGGASLLEISSEEEDMAQSVSWLHLKSARNVKDQARCGSCWAVTTINTLEANYEIHHDGTKHKQSSVQETLDCTPNPKECGGQGGCKGATVELGMAFIAENGVALEHEVPYQGKEQKCLNQGVSSSFLATMNDDNTLEALAKRTSPANAGGALFGFTGYTTLASNKAQPLRKALLSGPVAVSAAADAWKEYRRGIFDGCKKDAIINHAITMYGFGKDDGVKYWTIQNSWGPRWGEDGYIRLYRHDDDNEYCGIDKDNQQGTGCKDDPKEVPICGMCGILFDSVAPHFQVSTKGRLVELGSDGQVSSRAHAVNTTADNPLMRFQRTQATPHHLH